MARDLLTEQATEEGTEDAAANPPQDADRTARDGGKVAEGAGRPVEGGAGATEAHDALRSVKYHVPPDHGPEMPPARRPC